MNGYQITFFTQQNRMHGDENLAEWLVHLAQELNLHGVTLIPASEGIGRNHHFHSAHFFDLTDQPLAVVMAVTAEESVRLFERLHTEQVSVFYVKTAVEFGVLGEA